MSWPLFAVIQLVMITIGVVVAFVLRQRSLRASYQLLESRLEAAQEAVETAKARITEAPERVWLQDRIETLEGDDDVTVIQKLVLSNELAPSDEFQTSLTEKLSSAEAATDALAERWQQVRQSAATLTSELLEKYPLSHPVLSQLHQAYASLDGVFSIDTPQLPEAREIDSADITDITQEAEHLRATNELLQQEVDKLQSELSRNLTTGEEAEEQAEDLKGLLQQFTKDSRDMMACIQKLEAENANLRQQLGLEDNPEPAESQAPGSEAEDAA